MEKILIVILEARDIKSCEVHISNYKGNIKINEPNKCKELVWCDINNLPEDMIDFEVEAIKNNQKKIKFSVIDVDNEKSYDSLLLSKRKK